MLINSILLALRSIRRNLLRSFLTVLGIIIGVSSVITMVSLGEGATKAISDQIASLGTNLIMIRPGQRGPARDGSSAPRFKMSDIRMISESVDGVSSVVPSVNRSASIVYQANSYNSNVVGATADYFQATGWSLAEGEFFSDGDSQTGRPVCVIGTTIRKELFGDETPIGKTIRVKKFSCTVIGLLQSKGQSTFGTDQDEIVVLPLKTAQQRLTGSSDISLIYVSVVNASDIDSVKAALTDLMRDIRRVREGDDDNFFVMDTKQLSDTLTGTIKVMTMLLGAVAGVSLLVGGIGIMNIMLVSVTERTKEIGIRLAIGALEHEVLLQFLVEAVVLSTLGGIIGIVLATGASMGLASVMDVPYVPNLLVNAGAFGFSGLIGVIFGYFPARRAAGLDPIEALRHE